MQSASSKALLGVSAAALLAGGFAVVQPAAQSTGGAAAPAEQTAGQEGAAEGQAAGAAEGAAAGAAAEGAGAAAAGTAGDAAAGGAAAGQSGDAATGQSEAAAAAPAGAGPTAETVVATVTGTPITLGELIAARRSLPAEFQQLPDEVLMEALVEQIANQILLAEAARDAGLDRKPAVRLALTNQARAVLASAYMEDVITARVSDAAIEAAYQERVAGAAPVEEAHAAHILVEDEATAKEVKAKLDEGADFAALAAEYGTDGTASRGGDLGWFVHEQMVPPFADAVFAMAPDTVSGPVESPFGWHIIKLFEKRPQPVPPLDAVRDQIAAELAEAAQTQILGEIREGVAVEIDRAAAPSSAIRADALLGE